jgi:S1-C subfamily serine protease
VLPGGQRLTTPEVTVEAKSLSADLAVLKVPVDGLKPAGGRQTPVERWTPTVVVDASPVTRGPAISDGVVTRELAEGPAFAGGDPMYGLIEATTRATTAPLSPGALLLDDAGLVVGLVTDRARPVTVPSPTTRSTRTTRSTTRGTAASSATAAPEGPAGDDNVEHYAIPADYAWNVAAQLADSGKVVQPWVGLPTGEDLTADEANREQIVGGMRVTLIDNPSPAWGELQRNDVVIALESYNVTSYNAFVTALRRQKVGQYVKVRVLRKGSYENIVLGVTGKPEN